MAEFFSMLQTVFVCGALVFMTMLVLMALPQCRLRYVGLEMVKYGIVGGLTLLIILPTDLLPGVPIDDVFYLIGAIAAGNSASKDRARRRLLEEVEMAELARRREMASGQRTEAEAGTSESNQE